MKMFTCKFAQDEVPYQRLRVGSKKSVQQGRERRWRLFSTDP